MKTQLTLTVNGEERDLLIAVHRTLLEVLREDMGLTGTKHGCELGECGACTVLVDGQPVLSCLTLPVECQGRAITTVEGLAEGGRLHPLQQAFAELGAAQCGYCTPGMLMSACALIADNPAPTRDEVREALAGNLCRCTGYSKILDAVELAAQRLRRAGDSPGARRDGGFERSEAQARAGDSPGARRDGGFERSEAPARAGDSPGARRDEGVERSEAEARAGDSPGARRDGGFERSEAQARAGDSPGARAMVKGRP